VRPPSEFSWSDGWVITSVAALVIMPAYGESVLAPNDKRLHAMIEDTPEGSVPAQVHAAVMNPLFWVGSWGEMGLAASILVLVSTKPCGAASVIIVAVVGLLAMAIGWRLSRTASRQPSQTGRAD
jgi:hypothetical protein